METQLRILIEDMQVEANKWLEGPNTFDQGVIVVDWLRKLTALEKAMENLKGTIQLHPEDKGVILGKLPKSINVDEAYFQDDPNDTRLVTIVDGPLAGTLVPVACHMPNGAFVVIDNVNYQLDGPTLCAFPKN